MHEEQPKGPLRYFAAAVMALVLCTTAALAVENGERSLIPVGHTVGVKLFSRGVVVVKLPEGTTPARACGLKTGDVIWQRVYSGLHRQGGEKGRHRQRRGAAGRFRPLQ